MYAIARTIYSEWLTGLRQHQSTTGVVESVPRHGLAVDVAWQLHGDDRLTTALEAVRVTRRRPAVAFRGRGRWGQAGLGVHQGQLLYGGVEVVLDGGLHEDRLVGAGERAPRQAVLRAPRQLTVTQVALREVARRGQVEVGVGHAVQVVGRGDARRQVADADAQSVRGVRGQVGGRGLVQRAHVVVVGRVGGVAGTVGAAVVVVGMLLMLDRHHCLGDVWLHRQHICTQRHRHRTL